MSLRQLAPPPAFAPLPQQSLEDVEPKLPRQHLAELLGKHGQLHGRLLVVLSEVLEEAVERDGDCLDLWSGSGGIKI